MYKFPWLIVIFFLLSCSSEKPSDVSGQRSSATGGNSASEPAGPGSYSTGGDGYALEIAPANASRRSTLLLNAHGFNLSDAKTEWLINDRVSSSPNVLQFKAAETRKGDRVQARATIKGTNILSNIVQIKNTPPEISNVNILPGALKPGYTLSAEASASDVDGDDVTISYEWTKNGEPAGAGKKIAVPLKRGDMLDIKITPFDGEEYGRPVILHREIANLPPMITESKKSFSGDIFTCQIKATDPDGDPLTYSLKASPPGMTIDSSTGLIKWKVPSDFKGKSPFTVSVSDGHGGEASQSFNLEIKSEQQNK
jgi:hypothetical protein